MLLRINKLISVVFQPKYLLCTNVTLSTALSALGDILEQRLEILNGEQNVWDKKRTSNMGISGTTVGFFSHYWYLFLEKKIPTQNIRSVAKKIVLDQLIGTPIGISTLLITLCLLQRKSMREFKDDMKHRVWRLYFGEVLIWTPAQFINFYFVPYRYRVLYDNLISLAYDIFVSYVMNDLPEDVIKRTKTDCDN